MGAGAPSGVCGGAPPAAAPWPPTGYANDKRLFSLVSSLPCKKGSMCTFFRFKIFTVIFFSNNSKILVKSSHRPFLHGSDDIESAMQKGTSPRFCKIYFMKKCLF